MGDCPRAFVPPSVPTSPRARPTTQAEPIVRLIPHPFATYRTRPINQDRTEASSQITHSPSPFSFASVRRIQTSAQATATRPENYRKKTTSTSDNKEKTIVLADFVFDALVDPALFRTTAPEGYQAKAIPII